MTTYLENKVEVYKKEVKEAFDQDKFGIQALKDYPLKDFTYCFPQDLHEQEEAAYKMRNAISKHLYNVDDYLKLSHKEEWLVGDYSNGIMGLVRKIETIVTIKQMDIDKDITLEEAIKKL